MDDLNAFERQLEHEVLRAFGPPRPVDVAAIVRTATTRSTPSSGSRQRSRRLPIPIPYRRTQRPTATDTIEYQPSPIPASNGHTPTVIGRTQSMLSPVRAIAAGAIIFAIGGVMLVAQPFQQQSSVPGADVPVEGMEPAFFTGTLGEGWTPIGQGTVETRPDGVIVTTGGFSNIELTTNDPRMTGRLSMMKTEEDYRSGVLDDSPTGEVGAMRVGYMRIENDDGSWEGTVNNLQLENPQWEIDEGWFEGTGDYEGLTAYVVIENIDTIRGYITPTGPPPMPEPLPEQ